MHPSPPKSGPDIATRRVWLLGLCVLFFFSIHFCVAVEERFDWSVSFISCVHVTQGAHAANSLVPNNTRPKTHPTCCKWPTLKSRYFSNSRLAANLTPFWAHLVEWRELRRSRIFPSPTERLLPVLDTHAAHVLRTCLVVHRHR